ncbi:hypothetical protein [Pseudodesulfovibrio sediminis]|uniref:Uncharacterized protein n=1 Tax=Pseudodesulfovibrio sediminis TaxID=2810563 RepID=A0ABN6EQU1_9BACT|nr:hypothetical protein [Pseudodesulfovibrio sediminis]BCS87693.1 hypothetical protein PSDVSF_09350 [Pseudodesulfovibrio sediminis]
MDDKVLQELKLAFACDVYETVKAARKNRDEHVFRHTMAEEDGQMVFAGMFPKKDIMEFPNMTEEFVSKLHTFNLLGVVTDGESGLDMFYLGGMNKPFTSLASGQEMVKHLTDEPLMAFLEMYFKVKGIMMDFTVMNYEEFLQAIESEVFKNTSFSQMNEAQILLDAMKN